MKKIFYIFLALILIVWVIYFILSLSLKPFLLSQLSQALKTKVEAKSVSLSFPLNLEFGGLHIFNQDKDAELLRAENLEIGLNPFSFLSRRILLNHFILINPVFKLEKNTDGSLNISDFLKPAPGQKPAGKKNKSLLALRIEIKNGQVEFLDKTVPGGFTTKIDNLNLKIAKVYLPITSAKSNFNISFDLINPAGQVKGQSAAHGWINVIKKDMLAKMEIRNFDLTYFMPYYKSGFSSVEKGVLNFHSEVSAENNDLTATCKLEVNYLSFVAGSQAASTLFGLSVADLAEYLKDSQGKITMNFTLRGKMDKPQELLSQAGGVVINQTLKKLIKSQMERMLEFGEKTTSNAGSTKDKTQEKLQDIKKVLEGIFKQE